ncbi:MAG: hypothetical protein ACI392_05985 [Paludibacteraceae bacterium]
MKKIFSFTALIGFVCLCFTACGPKITEFHSEKDVLTFIDGQSCVTDFGTVKFKDGKVYDSEGDFISHIQRIRLNSVNPTLARVYMYFGKREVVFLTSCDPKNPGIQFRE